MGKTACSRPEQDNEKTSVCIESLLIIIKTVVTYMVGFYITECVQKFIDMEKDLSTSSTVAMSRTQKFRTHPSMRITGT
jgi:hypothetical protein